MRKATPFNFALYTQVLFWLALFTLLLFSFLNSGSVIGAAITAAVILVVCHMINFYIVFSWLTPAYFEKRKYAAFFLGVLLLLLLLTPIRMWIEDRFIHRPFLLLRGRRLRGLVIFSELTAVGFAFLFRMAIDSHIHKRRADDVERLQLETELKFLKSQMNPHFLFNTINNVYSLSLAGSERTPEALLKLSGLLRYLLYECNHKVPFSRELNALESYIALFQLRFEDPLNISLLSEVVRREMPVEPMLLIPLMENAIKHSGIGVAEGAYIEMKFREEEGRLLAGIRNSRTAEDYSKMPAAGGIGLPNIRKRLEMLGPGFSVDDLRIMQTSDVFEVWIRIPGY
jgi:hypothetical protein